jgi:predicted Zn-dependent peptidase
LTNGTKVFVAEDRTVPLVHITVTLRTGILEEAPEQSGLAALTGSLLRSGGAGDWDADALDELLENMVASVSSDVAEDMGTLALSCRVQDLPTCLGVLKAVLVSPRLDERRLSLAKAQIMEEIRRRKDDPSALAFLAFDETVYGADSPWARSSTLDTVGKLTREDVLAFHRDHILPCLHAIAVSGDVQKAELLPQLEGAFGALARREGQGPLPPPAPGIQQSRTILIPKSLNQATLMIGHAGPPNLLEGQPHPDRYALQVFNFIFGAGGFGSRLTKEVRVRKGLAYSVGAHLGMENGRGTIGMRSQTRTEGALEALNTMREVLEGVLAAGVTEDEVRTAKDSLVNAFVFRVATPANQVQNAALYDYAGLPPDYLSQYVSRIQAVTAEEVMRSARAHYHPERMSVVLCGNRETLEAPLQALGPVEIREP